MMGKKRVLVIYGGRSAEHEISCRSAAFVLKNLDRKKYDVQAVAIDKEGTWLPQDVAMLEAHLNESIPIAAHTPLQQMAALPVHAGLAAASVSALQLKGSTSMPQASSDLVIFPVLHGTFGEDGTLQGLLDLAEQAYVGPDTLGSAVGMDKGVAKRLVQSRGIAVGPFLEFRAERWQSDPNTAIETIQASLQPPWFVKPAKLGSSVGITRVKTAEELQAAIDYAFEFDEKILVEQGIAAREFEVAVLGGYEPEASIPGEVIPKGDQFYSYEAKYLNDDGAAIEVPARIDENKSNELRQLSIEAFKAMELYGMSRVDWFMDKVTGKFLFNEVNTIPGLTSISQFPMLWKHTGVEPVTLLDRLIELAVERRDRRRRLKRAR